MILADTASWVEFDRQTGSVVDDAMAELIAAIASRHDAALLTADVHLQRVACVIGLELYPVN